MYFTPIQSVFHCPSNVYCGRKFLGLKYSTVTFQRKWRSYSAHMFIYEVACRSLSVPHAKQHKHRITYNFWKQSDHVFLYFDNCMYTYTCNIQHGDFNQNTHVKRYGLETSNQHFKYGSKKTEIPPRYVILNGILIHTCLFPPAEIWGQGIKRLKSTPSRVIPLYQPRRTQVKEHKRQHPDLTTSSDL